MRPLILPIGPLVSFNGNRLTDHNRTELDISVKPIEYRKRMVNGTLRRQVIDEKRSFSLSWTDLPKDNSQTADGFWGARSLINFYNNNKQDFVLKIIYGNNTEELVNVMFENMDYKIKKRSVYTDLYDISISLDEI